MTNQNNTPASPGLHYRRDETGFDVVRVFDRAGRLFYADTGEFTTGFILAEDDGKWAGPVPMPGEPCGDCHGMGSVT